jgi:carboxymethylenebutenolidase
VAQNVRIPREGGDIGGLYAAPDGQGPFPGVVVIPTIRGNDQFVAAVVDRLASDAFAALCVDIFDHPGVPENPFERPGSQPDERTFGDLDAGVTFLKNQRGVDANAICAWGYCIGGRFSLLWPSYRPELAATAAFHGFPVGRPGAPANPNTPTEAVEVVNQLQVPVSAHFGELDALVPLELVEQYRQALQQHGKDFELYVYPGADHGWTSKQAPAYHEQHAEDAWKRAVRFLKDRVEAARKQPV